MSIIWRRGILGYSSDDESAWFTDVEFLRKDRSAERISILY